MKRIAIACLAILAACQFDEKAIGPGSDQIAVHAVLDPGQLRHRILLEHVLTGRNAISDKVAFDSLDPVVTHGGVPVSGAMVIVYGPAGDSAVASERLAGSDNHGTGMYEFLNRADAVVDPPVSPSVPILPGNTYQLHITTGDGRVLRATTTVPNAISTTRDPAFQPFNRDHDAKFLYWDEVPGAYRYLVTASSPRGAFHIFVDSLEFLLNGTIKNISSETFSDVFVPGFVQDVTTAAVDRNYFDYYRSKNDDYSGRGLINHVEGGLGVFGSMVLLRFLRLDVTADVDQRVEGTYSRVEGPGPEFIEIFTNGGDAAQADLSGRYLASGIYLPGILGTLRLDSMSLALLRGQSAHDTSMVIDGVLDGENLRGRLRSDGARVIYRRYVVP